MHKLSIAEPFNLQKPHLFKTEDIGRGNWLSVKDVTKLKNMYDCAGDKNVTLYSLSIWTKRACNVQECNAQDCVWGQWSSWSAE